MRLWQKLTDESIIFVKGRKMDKYKTAVELYVSCIRSLEQRSGVFLLMQSILVASYVALLVKNNDLILFTVGISAIGIIICIVFFLAGKTTSVEASVWQSYMIEIEKKEPSTEAKELHWGYYKETYSKRADCITKTALGRFPAPTLWLFSPSVFLTAWICSFVVLFNWHWIWLIIIPIVLISAVAVYYFLGTKVKDM